MNKLEMIQKLAENPKRKGKYGDLTFYFNEYQCLIKESENKTTDDVKIYLFDLTSEGYDIIEPPRKLKEMSFGVAFKTIINSHQKTCKDMKSVVTGKDYTRLVATISDEELEEKWTIEGVCEGE